jgi:hypothetical protein
LNFQYVLLDRSYFAYERDVGNHLDGDGDNDVVGIQEGDTTLPVFRAPSRARSTLVSFTGTFRYPRADDFKLADIDGDGDLNTVTRLAIAQNAVDSTRSKLLWTTLIVPPCFHAHIRGLW